MRVLSTTSLIALALSAFSVSANAQCWSLDSGTVVCNPVKENLTDIGCVELLSGTVVC